MADNLHLPAATLPSFGYLRSLSVITSDYIAEAVKDWESNPPIEEFTNFLDCDLESLQDRAGGSGKDATDLGLPEFYFNSRSQRYHYRDSGAFVPQAAVDNLTARAIAQKRNQIRDLGEQLIGGKISLEDWEKETAGHLKQLHTWTYLIGKGGQKNMTQSDCDALTANRKRSGGSF